MRILSLDFATSGQICYVCNKDFIHTDEACFTRTRITDISQETYLQMKILMRFELRAATVLYRLEFTRLPHRPSYFAGTS
jgi:hypothetical protein